MGVCVRKWVSRKLTWQVHHGQAQEAVPEGKGEAAVPSPNVEFKITDLDLTAFGGASIPAQAAQRFGLFELLGEAVSVKVRNRGASEAETHRPRQQPDRPPQRLPPRQRPFNPRNPPTPPLNRGIEGCRTIVRKTYNNKYEVYGIVRALQRFPLDHLVYLMRIFDQ